MASITLNDIVEAAEAQYGNLDITLDDGFVATLLNPLRLSDDARAEVSALQDEDTEIKDEDGNEVSERYRLHRMIELICEKPAQAKRLLAPGVLGGEDLTKLVVVLEKYGKVTQAGEASASGS